MFETNKPRLVGRRPVSSDMKKLECLFAEAAKASNTPDGIQARQAPNLKYALKGHKGKGIAEKQKSWYSQFETEVLSWANRADRKAGDMRIISNTRNTAENTFCLVEADGKGGYVEILTGSYKGVLEEYERAYGKAADSVYVCAEAYAADQRRDIWDLQPDEIGRYAFGDYDTLEGIEFQRYSTGDVEHLRSSNKETSPPDPEQVSDSQSSAPTKLPIQEGLSQNSIEISFWAESMLFETQKTNA